MIDIRNNLKLLIESEIDDIRIPFVDVLMTSKQKYNGMSSNFSAVNSEIVIWYLF
ncbi:hypothetical protein [Staphylococcus pseudintermedius]|uniref:hypothetical protein n=1 Tax=Staphylococcus pseudintermedius TaxID=283734 RepID=UPI002B4A2CEA|nr:hypothetical protein [Staphylococcus pseudintermedius]